MSIYYAIGGFLAGSALTFLFQSFPSEEERELARKKRALSRFDGDSAETTPFSKLFLQAEAHPKELLYRYSRDIVDDLLHLHREGIIHGNLSPDTAALDPKGCKMQLTHYDKSFDALRGPPQGFRYDGWFTPPELLSIDKGTIDYEKVEIWILGVMIYIAYTNDPPPKFIQNSYNRTLIFIEEIENKGIRDPFLRLVADMCNKDPKMRRSLQHVRKALSAYIDEEEVALSKRIITSFRKELTPLAAHFAAQELCKIKKLCALEQPIELAVNRLSLLPLSKYPSFSHSELVAHILGNDHACQDKVIAALCKNHSLRWLKELLPRQQQYDETLRVERAICRIFPNGTRIKMLSGKIAALKSGFSQSECLHLGVFLSAHMPIGYMQAAVHGIPTDIEYDGTNCLLRTRRPKEYGTYKRVYRYKKISLTDESPPETVVVSINKTKKDGSLIDVHQSIRDVKTEVQYQRLFYALEPEGVGIWPILQTFEWKKRCVDAKGAYAIPKIGICSKEGMTLDTFIKTTNPNYEMLLEIAKQVLTGLAKIHSLGYSYADLKQNNILCSVNPLKAGINDFGQIYPQKTVKETLPLCYDMGFYGCISYTAPELMGNTCFRGDVAKLDLFAFGCIFYECVYKKLLPWKCQLDPYAHAVLNHPGADRSYNKPVTEADKAAIKSLIEAHHMQPNRAPLDSAERHLNELITKCLSLEPESRPSSSTLLSTL